MADEHRLNDTAFRLLLEPGIDSSLRRNQIISTCLILLAVSCTCCAQTLHAPSRSIYRCDLNGTTTYSDAPCLGAKRLEIEPTRGVGKTAGYDVQREKQRETIAESIRPLTGLDAKQLEVQGRRMKLHADAQRECRKLDVQIPETERSEDRATGEQRNLARDSLYKLRQRQRSLRC